MSEKRLSLTASYCWTWAKRPFILPILLMIKLTAVLVSDFEVAGFIPALLAAVVISLLALIGFGLLQWSTMGEVHWMLKHNNPGVFT